ncbi:hypothetical protein M514_26454 [Trichuris suis]|uniref:Uncharacterized protein n=1 Tax=Trichuris suis TaxID=68888 RepID=A0A085MW03_9BILA|nr:hypothetical protein M514_26454 [Trichuris suis]
MIVSLAFAPTGDLEEALTEVSRVLLRELLPALAWFEITYLSRPKSSGGRGIPAFPPNIWSVYQRMLIGRHRTNNFVEAAHRRMRIAFGCESSNVTGNQYAWMRRLMEGEQCNRKSVCPPAVVGRQSIG